MNSTSAIDVHELHTHYGERHILKGVNLQVNTGEIMTIMGGSGCGKSTLLRHLIGLNRPTSGTIKLLGKDINAISEQEFHELRQQTGVAFQGGALFGSMTVGENVMLPLKEHTKLNEATMRIMSRMKLEVVNLAGFDDLMPSELSGGMIKRAALARAVVMDPKLLFFDEPSAGLDPVVSAELDELIIRLRDAMNITIVVVTHELDSIYKISDRITILDEGKVLLTGTIAEVKASTIERVQNLLQRRPNTTRADAEEYLQRLTR